MEPIGPTWTEILRDWWQFLGFALGGLVALVTLRERTRWRLDQLGHEVERLQAEVAELRRQERVDTKALAEISATQTAIQTTLTAIWADLRGKADK